jgi:hypothetical protein
MNKKGQGISINVIIIAALAILVLVVLALIFLGYVNKWTGDVTACENKGGKCYTEGVCPEGWAPLNNKCTTQGAICCTNTGIGG